MCLQHFVDFISSLHPLQSVTCPLTVRNGANARVPLHCRHQHRRQFRQAACPRKKQVQDQQQHVPLQNFQDSARRIKFQSFGVRTVKKTQESSTVLPRCTGGFRREKLIRGGSRRSGRNGMFFSNIVCGETGFTARVCISAAGTEARERWARPAEPGLSCVAKSCFVFQCCG